MFRLLLPKKILSLLLFNSSGTNPKPSIFFALWHFQHCHWLFAHCKHGDGFDNDCISCDGIVCHSLEITHFSTNWYYNCCDWHRKYGEYYKSIPKILFFFKKLLHYQCTSCQLVISSHQNIVGYLLHSPNFDD